MKNNLQKFPKLKKYQMINVKWNDIISDNSGWLDESNYDYDRHAEVAEYESVGYFTSKTDRFLFLCMSVNKEREVTGMMLAIPTGTIKSINILGE